MRRDRLTQFTIGPEQTLRDAMTVITDNWREVALVTDDALRVLGVITDGDIRRGLMAGLTLDSLAAQVMTRNYISAPIEADRATVLDLMKARSIRHVPVLDAE